MLGRTRQFVVAVLTRQNTEVDARLRALCPSDSSWRLLERLTPYDRRHALAVHELLTAYGCTDNDVLLAAILHDVGKADARTRVRLAHRVALVVGRRLAPRSLARASAVPQHNRVLHGLYLANKHAELGARAAARVGLSPGCCALIAAHDAPPPHDDARLALLIWADERAL